MKKRKGFQEKWASRGMVNDTHQLDIYAET